MPVMFISEFVLGGSRDNSPEIIASQACNLHPHSNNSSRISNPSFNAFPDSLIQVSPFCDSMKICSLYFPLS